MPESGNIHSAIGVVNAANHTVGADDNLANGGISKFWHHAPSFVLLTRNWAKATARSGESSEM